MNNKNVAKVFRGFLVLVAATATSTACRKVGTTTDSLTDAAPKRPTLIATSNGRGYGGMIAMTGQYLNIPNLPLMINFSQPGYEYAPYLVEDLNGSGRPLSFSDVEIALYNLEVVGYEAGIFEKNEFLAGTSGTVIGYEGTPYFESWCRWVGTGDYGIDVLVRGNPSDNGVRAYTAKIIVADGQHTEPTYSFPTVREVAYFSVSAENNSWTRSYAAPAFSLVIKWSEPAEGGNKFAAEWTATINGEDYVKPMLCRSVNPGFINLPGGQ